MRKSLLPTTCTTNKFSWSNFLQLKRLSKPVSTTANNSNFTMKTLALTTKTMNKNLPISTGFLDSLKTTY
jgi:hypothetical protein